eukprot:XP_019080294.1 PREDICTED: serine/threonine-protein kinase TNNI3K isoform X2 [Vitis vinifera]
MLRMLARLRHKDPSDDFDMQLIGTFLSFASRGDRVGLNQMLREGTSPNVQDYDKRTALHLAASEGHASIVELLLHYSANVNLEDRWQKTPLTDARLYGHRDICRILEVSGGTDSINDNPMTVRHEQDSNEVNFDISELNLQHSSKIEQGLFGESEKVKWRGTWVVKTVIRRQIYDDRVTMILSAKENTLLRELRHPNILQFLGSIVHGEEMILITEHLSKGNLKTILEKKNRLDLATSVRYALDIARGMNYLHEHKPSPIVHNHLDLENLLQDEGGHLKIGDYWVQMLYERQNCQDSCQSISGSGIISNPSNGTMKDIYAFGFIFHQMLEGSLMNNNKSPDNMHLKSGEFEPKFYISRCPKRIQELIEQCVSGDPSQTPTFASVIAILEEVSMTLGRPACPVC